MKKLLFVALATALTTVAFVCCNNKEDDTTTSPTDYYTISMSESYTVTAPPTQLVADIKACYQLHMFTLCTNKGGYYVTTKSEAEIAASFGETEIAAQLIRDASEWVGEISVTVIHCVNGAKTTIYTHSFSKTDLTPHVLVQSINVDTSMCVGIDATTLMGLRTKFDTKNLKIVLGQNNIATAFTNLKDSVQAKVKIEGTKLAANKAIALLVQQRDTCCGKTQKIYIVASKDSVNASCSSQSAVEDLLNVVYKFECSTNQYNSIWTEFYRKQLIDTLGMVSAGGTMKYQFPRFIPNPITSDSIMVATMAALESKAIKWHADQQCQQACTIKVYHNACFFEKVHGTNPLYEHIFPAERPQ